MKYLKLWGCLTNVNIPINKKRKIGPKLLIVFVGYSLHNTTYRFLVVNLEVSEISNDTIMESRDVTFFENVFPLKNKLSKFVCDTSCSNLSSCSNANKDIVFEPRRSKRYEKVKDFGFEFCYFLLKDDPKTYGEVMRSIDAPFWKENINDKMSSLKTNKTWFLTNLPLVVKV